MRTRRQNDIPTSDVRTEVGDVTSQNAVVPFERRFAGGYQFMGASGAVLGWLYSTLGSIFHLPEHAVTFLSRY